MASVAVDRASLELARVSARLVQHARGQGLAAVLGQLEATSPALATMLEGHEAVLADRYEAASAQPRDEELMARFREQLGRYETAWRTALEAMP